VASLFHLLLFDFFSQRTGYDTIAKGGRNETVGPLAA